MALPPRTWTSWRLVHAVPAILVALLGLLWILGFTANLAVADLIASFVQWLAMRPDISVPAILSLALLYHHSRGTPDPFLLPGIKLRPGNSDTRLEDIVPENQWIFEREKEHAIGRPDREWIGPWRRSVYELHQDPDQLQVNFDIGNRGRSGTTVHEFEVQGHEEDEVLLKALYEDEKIRIPEPVQEVLRFLGEGTRSVADLLPERGAIGRISDILQKYGEDPPKHYFVKSGHQRLFLEPGERTTESFRIPVSSEGEDHGSRLENGSLYHYTISIVSTERGPADEVSVSVVHTGDRLEWWTSRFPFARHVKAFCWAIREGKLGGS